MTSSPTASSRPAPRGYFLGADPWSRTWAYDGGRRLAFGAAAHAHGELALIEAGEATYVIGRRIVHVSAGQLAWIPPGVEHRTSFGTRLSALALGIPLSPDELRETGLDEVAVWSGQPALQALVREVTDPRQRNADHARLALTAARDALCLRLAGASPVPGSATGEPRSVRRVIDQIHAELAAPLTIEALAMTAGLSRFHFSRVFRAATGLSPYQYILEARLQAARALVRASTRSMTDIALACGFSDASRFAHLFRRRWGVTPIGLRNQRR